MIQELTNQLYEKLNKECKEFISDIIKTDSQNIVNNAYKITMIREFVDIFYGTEKFNKHEINILLEKENTLEFLLNQWEDKNYSFHYLIEENMMDCLEEFTKDYLVEFNKEIKNDSNYELLKDMSDALKDFNNYNFCDYIKQKYNVDNFEVIDVHEIMNKVGGAEYLYHYFAQLVDDNHLQYLNEISVINSDNYKNIEEKILPKLKEIMNNEKNKNNINKDKERDER